MKKNIDIINIIFFLLLFIITTGYASYNIKLDLSSKLTINKFGKVVITSIKLDSEAPNNLPKNSGSLILSKDGNINIDYNFSPVSGSNNNYSCTYLITIQNNSPYDYYFNGINFNPNIKITSNDKTTGATLSYIYDLSNRYNTIKPGDKFLSNTSKIFAITLKFNVASKIGGKALINGSISHNTTLDNKGNILGSIKVKDIDLSTNDIGYFDIEVINTYQYAKSFILISSNKNFILLNEDKTFLNDLYIDGTPLNNKKVFRVYIKKSSDSIFSDNMSSTTIVLRTNDNQNIALNKINIKVKQNNISDSIIPEISNVKFNVLKYDVKNKSLVTNISFKRMDKGGSDITSYSVELYNVNNSKPLYKYTSSSSLESFNMVLDNNFLTSNDNLININNDDFYIRVYGSDKSGNTGKNNCNGTSIYCPKSNNTKLKYIFNIDTTKLVNLNIENTSNKVYLNNEYTTKINTSSNDYTIPGNIKVYMDGVLLEKKDYNYSQNENTYTSSTFHINKDIIKGDIVIEGIAIYNGGVCLVEGTLIKLSNNKYKKIEDIEYTDLLEVFSYDLGKVVYEYPIWIEKEGITESYQKTTFSDGSFLETVGSHGIFSEDLNKYVSVLDRDNFHIGTKVVKITEDNKLSVVKVKSIETIKKKVKYYHVSSTRYHNVIANNLLTTDAMLVISNMFPFNKDIKWTSVRDKFLSKNDLFYYYDWLDYFPKHIFEGFRMEEAKYLYNKGLLNIDMFSNLLNRLIKQPLKNNNNINMWPITTEDNVNSKLRLYEEGSYYIVPLPKDKNNFIGWYNTSDNKVYFPGDKIEVKYGMHFIYKKDITNY